jgi:hypothetical protein
MKATKDTNSAQEIRPLVQAEMLLTETDVDLLAEREELKAKLKQLDDYLKPMIAATINRHGTGRLLIGNRQVELKRSVRESVAWKPLCYSLVDEAAILSVQSSFTEPYNVDSAKVLS